MVRERERVRERDREREMEERELRAIWERKWGRRRSDIF